jgi:hypothetical protein
MEASFLGYPFKTMWRGLTVHVFALVLLIGAVFFGVQGFMNLLTWGSLIYTFLMVVLLFTSSDGLKPNIPPIISGALFGVMIILTVWHGHFLVGTAWLISGLILGHLTDEYTRKQAELEAKEIKSSTTTVQQSSSTP